MVPHRSRRLCSFFSNLFLRLNNFHCSIFNFADLLFCLLTKSLNLSTKFFITVIVLFRSRICIWLLFMFPISSLTFFLFMHSFLDFFHIFLSALNIFKRVVLKLLCNISAIRSFSPVVFIDFPPLNGPYFISLHAL
uniref:Uncharacterized protein n=1 Tax=Pipistrellus kuhlii TaxID=59472 RepID=A0A7J7ZJK1_PIPKU|nr:hypothetical protein mPipKuh1_009481 [Pipistrellus kuhlii]